MKNSFVLYTDYYEHFSLLTLEQQGTLINVIFKYQLGEELPEMDIAVKMAFSFVKSQLDRDNEKYEQTCRQRSEAGKKGGRPKKEKPNGNSQKQEKAKKSNAFQENQMKANKADNEYDTVNENEYEIVNDTLSYTEVVDIAKAECPTIYERHSYKVDTLGKLSVVSSIHTLLVELSSTYTYQQIRELFSKANKMYCTDKKYSGCDLLWLLNNLREIENSELSEQPKNNDLPTCSVREVNGVYKI